MRGVVPIRDGSFAFDPRLMPGVRADPGEAARLLGAGALPETVEVPVWCYLIETGDGPGLVDTGGGALMGAGFGALAGRLAALGVAPRDIRTVWLTHLHGDHCGGLLDSDGAAAFPEARIALAEAEAAFWLDIAPPAPLRPIAEDARRALAPYAGRVDRVREGDPVGPAVAQAAHGHTAGHTAWAFEDHDALAAGDIFHVPALQLARPDWSTDWDHDAAAATRARQDLTCRAAGRGWMLLTGHGGTLAPRPEGWAPNETE